jgi:hypothetical protein
MNVQIQENLISITFGGGKPAPAEKSENKQEEQKPAQQGQKRKRDPSSVTVCVGKKDKQPWDEPEYTQYFGAPERKDKIVGEIAGFRHLSAMKTAAVLQFDTPQHATAYKCATNNKELKLFDSRYVAWYGNGDVMPQNVYDALEPAPKAQKVDEEKKQD